MIFNFPEDEIKKVKVFYKFHDDSPITVVFIHGYASNHHGFDRVSKELDKLKISYFTFDLPGHGISPMLEDTVMHINYFVKISEDVIRYYHLKNIVLVGHSMGGGIVSLLFPKISLLIKQIVLIDPLNRTIYSQGLSMIGMVNSTICNNPHKLAKIFLKNHIEYKKQFENEYETVVIKPFQTFSNNPTGYLKLGASLLSLNVLGRIDKNIKNSLKPITLIMGENDKIFDATKTIKWIFNLNKGVDVFIVSNTGHAPFLEDCSSFLKYFFRSLKIKGDSYE